MSITRMAAGFVSAMLVAVLSGGCCRCGEVEAIGVFDSGTGGLTVLEKLLTQDAFVNADGKEGADGIPDFAGEKFVYFADSANMSYGVYPLEGKADYLRELVKGDARFVLGRTYWKDISEAEPSGKKYPAKIVVIACNTATAHGLEDVRDMLKGTGKDVIGVIGAGSKAALDASGDGRRAIGVMATYGTISSGAYERTLRAEAEKRGSSAGLVVVNQAAYGLAEAVDRLEDYVDDSLSAPRANYRGPRLGEGEGRIELPLIEKYAFDYSGNKMLVKKAPDGTYAEFQLNDPVNYVRYNFLSMVEKLRVSGGGAKLEAVVLGCTHFPYMTGALEEYAKFLRTQNEYRELISDKLVFIDPAVYAARECYRSLRASGKLRNRPWDCSVEAYISVPDKTVPPDKIGKDGRLVHEFKYSRKVGDPTGTRAVPFSKTNIDAASLERLRFTTPAVYKAIAPFVK